MQMMIYGFGFRDGDDSLGTVDSLFAVCAFCGPSPRFQVLNHFETDLCDSADRRGVRRPRARRPYVGAVQRATFVKS